MSTVLPSGLGDLGCGHIPGAWAACCQGSTGVELREWGRCACNGVLLPWTLSAWSPVNGTPISRSRGGPPRAVKPRIPRLRLSHRIGRALTCHLVSKSPSGEAPTSSFLLGAALPKYYLTLRSTVQGGLGIWGSTGEGGKSQKTRALAHSTLIYNPGTQLSLGLRLPKKLEGGMKDRCRLVDVSCNNNLKTG